MWLGGCLPSRHSFVWTWVTEQLAESSAITHQEPGAAYIKLSCLSGSWWEGLARSKRGISRSSDLALCSNALTHCPRRCCGWILRTANSENQPPPHLSFYRLSELVLFPSGSVEDAGDIPSPDHTSITHMTHRWRGQSGHSQEAVDKHPQSACRE